MEYTILRVFGTDVEANLALELLRTSGIAAELKDEHMISEAPGFAGMLGGIKLLVPVEQEAEAEALLQECAVEEGTLGEELDEEGVQVESILRETNALLTGHFKLTSGRHSNAYIEKIRIINNPGQVVRLCAMLAERFEGVPCDVVVGPAMGGVVLAYEVARALGRNFVFTQRYDGVMGIRGGFPLEPGMRALVIEDIVTTGGSVFEVLECLRRRQIEVVGVGLIVDRSGGKVDFGVPTQALLTLDIQSWEPEACPLCAEGKPFNTPGSSDK